MRLVFLSVTPGPGLCSQPVFFAVLVPAVARGIPSGRFSLGPRGLRHPLRGRGSLVRQQPPHQPRQINQRTATGCQDNALLTPFLRSNWESSHEHRVQRGCMVRWGDRQGTLPQKKGTPGGEGPRTRLPAARADPGPARQALPLRAGTGSWPHGCHEGGHSDRRESFHLTL